MKYYWIKKYTDTDSPGNRLWDWNLRAGSALEVSEFQHFGREGKQDWAKAVDEL